MKASAWAAVALLAAGQAGAAVPQAVSQAVPQAVMGLWWTQDRDGVVELYPCANGLCGRVAGIVHWNRDGGPPTDLHGHSRCHLGLIAGGTADGTGMWDSHITNPDDDKTYTIRLRVDPDGRLRMRGYIAIPLLGQTVYWTHFNAHLSADCHIRD